MLCGVVGVMSQLKPRFFDAAVLHEGLHGKEGSKMN
jgi:hypothetical protein